MQIIEAKLLYCSHISWIYCSSRCHAVTSICVFNVDFAMLLFFFHYYRANDNPHGIFKLQPGAQKLEVAGNSRKLQFAVLREKGTFGAVDILYEVRHSEWYPVEMKGHVTVPHQQNQVRWTQWSLGLETLKALVLCWLCSYHDVTFSSIQSSRSLESGSDGPFSSKI